MSRSNFQPPLAAVAGWLLSHLGAPMSSTDSALTRSSAGRLELWRSATRKSVAIARLRAGVKPGNKKSKLSVRSILPCLLCCHLCIEDSLLQIPNYSSCEIGHSASGVLMSRKYNSTAGLCPRCVVRTSCVSLSRETAIFLMDGLPAW